MTANVAFNNQDLGVNKMTHRPVKNMTLPSPQLSQDDLITHLAVFNAKENSTTAPDSPTSSSGLQSPVAYQLSKDQMVPEGIKDDDQTESDIALMLYMEFMGLIHWKIPGRSGIILAGVLSSLVLTHYYSPLYVFAASFTILTGFNLIFVNAYNLIRTVWTGRPVEEFTHPYHIHIGDYRPNIVSRDMIAYYTNKVVDVLELVAQKMAKIVFVADTRSTAISFFSSGFIYVTTGLISTKIFFGLFILALFTVPYFYEQHKKEMDVYISVAQEKCQQLATKYGQLIHSKSAVLFSNAKISGGRLITVAQEMLQKSKQTPQNEKTDDVVKTTLTDSNITI